MVRRMQFARRYAGPLRDTVIQSWQDPVEGALCYVCSAAGAAGKLVAP
jgi:hypothetical protein